MKDDSNQGEEVDDNIVSFPIKSSIPPARQQDLDDPLEELMNEFSHLDDHDFPEDYLSSELEGGHEVIAKEESPLSQLELIISIERKLNSLAEMNKKVRFYLDEIETFLPRGRAQKK